MRDSQSVRKRTRPLRIGSRRTALTREQGRLLEGIMKQIEEAVPQVIDLANELTQYPQQHKSGEMQLY